MKTSSASIPSRLSNTGTTSSQPFARQVFQRQDYSVRQALRRTACRGLRPDGHRAGVQIVLDRAFPPRVARSHDGGHESVAELVLSRRSNLPSARAFRASTTRATIAVESGMASEVEAGDLVSRPSRIAPLAVSAPVRSSYSCAIAPDSNWLRLYAPESGPAGTSPQESRL